MLQYRQSVFFMYEKRLRSFSPPEKVFEYFASVSKKDGKFMVPADMMRACVPVFAPDGSDVVKSGGLGADSKSGKQKATKVFPKTTPKFFQLFDTDGDGLIDFPEYIFFMTLLGIPVHDIAVAFTMMDTDDSGFLDQGEFKAVMASLRATNKTADRATGIRPGAKGHTNVAEGGLLTYFFGKKGDGKLTLKKFEEFLNKLHDEIVLLEFNHYDYKGTGFITYKDFAMSLVASGNVSDINKYLARVATLPPQPGSGITLAEFKQVYRLRPRLHDMTVALNTYGGAMGSISKADFERAAKRVCHVELTPVQLDIMYHVFDLDGDGTLDAEELVHMISGKMVSGGSQHTNTESLMGCCMDCFKNRALMADAVKAPES